MNQNQEFGHLNDSVLARHAFCSIHAREVYRECILLHLMHVWERKLTNDYTISIVFLEFVYCGSNRPNGTFKLLYSNSNKFKWKWEERAIVLTRFYLAPTRKLSMRFICYCLIWHQSMLNLFVIINLTIVM